MLTISLRPTMRHYVPGFVYQQSPFGARFYDLPNCDASTQEQLAMTAMLPGRPFVACVGDMIEDPKTGRYFTCWLASRINDRSRSASPMYVNCASSKPDPFTGVVWAPELKQVDAPCCLILIMGKTMDDVQVERARDLMAKHDVPALVHCSEMSPLEIAKRLMKPCHFPFYLTKQQSYDV